MEFKSEKNKGVFFGYDNDGSVYELHGNPIPISASVLGAIKESDAAAAIVIKAVAIYFKDLDPKLFTTLNRTANELRWKHFKDMKKENE